MNSLTPMSWAVVCTEEKKLELRRRRQRHGGGSGYCWSEVQVWTWFVCKVKDIVEFHWKMSVTMKKILSLILNDSLIWPTMATNFFNLREVSRSYWEWHIFRMTMNSLMPMSWAVVCTEAEKRTRIAAVMAMPRRWRQILLIRGSISNLIFL